jgi:lisH domain-containing protein FOPNL
MEEEQQVEDNSMVAADGDLVMAIEEALKRRGVLNKMKAQMRAEVFHAMQDKIVLTPDKPPDVFLATELIREFLMTFKLHSTLSVFCEEFGQPFEMSTDREFVGGELGVNTFGSNEKIPLLVLLVQLLKANRTECLQTNTSLDVENDPELK